MVSKIEFARPRKITIDKPDPFWYWFAGWTDMTGS